MRHWIVTYLALAGTVGSAPAPLSHLAPHALSDQGASVVQATDLCAPCDDGDQCSSGLCLIDNATNEGICTQKCTTSGTTACPVGFVCTTSAGSAFSQCNPNDDTICPAMYAGAQLNDICEFPASDSDDSQSFSRPCASPNAVCFIFPTGIGACLSACNAIDPNYACQQGENCCFGLDANGLCLPSSASSTNGGCIQIQDVGDNCAQADHSVCVAGAGCFSPGGAGAAANSTCYALCPAGTCGAGGICITISDTPVCCDESQYNVNDPVTCVPVAGACRLGVGVACTYNADCRQNYCLQHNGASACSVPCHTDADCPSASEDVNDDGVADGGGACLTVGVQGNYCWPNQGPAAQPNCFTQAGAAEAAAAAASGSGCTCQATQAQPMWGCVVALGAVLGLRRRRRRADASLYGGPR